MLRHLVEVIGIIWEHNIYSIVVMINNRGIPDLFAVFQYTQHCCNLRYKGEGVAHTNHSSPIIKLYSHHP